MWKTGQNKNVEIRKGRRVKQRCPSNSNLCLNQIIHTHTHLQKLFVLPFDCSFSDNSLHFTGRGILSQDSDKRKGKAH